MSGGDADHGLTRLRRVLIVLAQASVTPLPRIGPLHDPTHRQSALNFVSPLDGSRSPAGRAAGGGTASRTTRSCGTWHRRRLTCSAEVRPRTGRRRPAARASSTLAAVTTTAIKKPRESTRIWRLRPWTSLPPSIPRPLPPRAVLTDWLSMAAAAGRRRPPGLGFGQGTEEVENLLPGAVRVPFPEVVIHGIPGREVMRQAARGAAFAGVIETCALTTSRRSTSRGRPGRDRRGGLANKGSIRAHC